MSEHARIARERLRRRLREQVERAGYPEGFDVEGHVEGIVSEVERARRVPAMRRVVRSLFADLVKRIPD